MNYIFNIFCIALLIVFTETTQAESSSSLSLDSGTEISYTRFAADSQQLILWFYSEAGPQSGDIETAKQLASSGHETWLIDVFDSYFLPVSLSSMDKLPADDLSEFIFKASQMTGKQVIVVTSGRSAIPLLRATRQLQINHAEDPGLTGLILISPKFYLQTPAPGTEPSLMPIVEHSNVLLFVIQPEKSPWYWKLDQTIPALEKSGSDVYLQRIAGVRDRFYFRPDASQFEQTVSHKLPAFIINAATALKRFPEKTRAAVNVNITQPSAQSTKKEKLLRPHQGNSEPEKLSLLTYDNHAVTLKELKGKVVLVNFWATWCPPCVHEMPSMQSLQDKFDRDDFVILGVNMAEDRQQIEKFLAEKVSVNFPVLMDSDGQALKRWKVFAFPTSYVVDKKGKIRYSLFGSIEWDQPDPVSKIQRLIAE